MTDPLLSCRNGHNGCPFLGRLLHQGEEKHDETKLALGNEIPVVDPEPPIMVANGDKNVTRFMSI